MYVLRTCLLIDCVRYAWYNHMLQPALPSCSFKMQIKPPYGLVHSVNAIAAATGLTLRRTIKSPTPSASNSSSDSSSRSSDSETSSDSSGRTPSGENPTRTGKRINAHLRKEPSSPIAHSPGWGGASRRWQLTCAHENTREWTISGPFSETLHPGKEEITTSRNIPSPINEQEQTAANTVQVNRMMAC